MINSVIASDLKNFEPTKTRYKPLALTAMNRVLIIEDDISLTNLMTTVLEEISPNIKIDWATSGEEAEAYLMRESEIHDTHPYDLVVADIFLEGEITGLDIWKLCDQKYPKTQILVTSSLPVERFVSCLKNEYSCPNYLPKPFTLSECKETISEFL